MDAAGRERSNLAVKVTDFGGKEVKKEWHNRASESVYELSVYFCHH